MRIFQVKKGKHEVSQKLQKQQQKPTPDGERRYLPPFRIQLVAVMLFITSSCGVYVAGSEPADIQTTTMINPMAAHATSAEQDQNSVNEEQPLTTQTPDQEPIPATPEPATPATAELSLATPATAESSQATPEPTPEPEPETGRIIDPSLPMVALTFDDGPHELTTKILDILEQHDAVATFYVIGRQVDKHSETVQRAYDMGCEIANHTWSHSSLERSSAVNIRSQLNDTNVAVEKVIGVAPTSMRPPFGRSNSTVHNVAGELGLAVVFWTIDPSDYLNRSVDRLYSFIMDQVSDRDIILLHDVYDRSIETAERLIPDLIDMGFQLVTVSELMYYSDIPFEPGKVYNHGRPR